MNINNGSLSFIQDEDKSQNGENGTNNNNQTHVNAMTSVLLNKNDSDFIGSSIKLD